MGNNLAQINLQDFGNSQESVQRWISQVSFNEADHRLRETGALRNHVHGEPLLLSFLTQEMNHTRDNSFSQTVF